MWTKQDDIENIDLLARDCQIRYIITKQALQEGWDCPFASVLAVLTNPASKISLTQLVGRVLRQPLARKTKIKELNESYVLCFQQRAPRLLDNIKEGLEKEGLGDLRGHVSLESEKTEGMAGGKEQVAKIRKKFRKFAGRIYLPVFVIKYHSRWRQLSYEMDLVSRIDWSQADFSSLFGLPLQEKSDEIAGTETILNQDENEVVRKGRINLLRGEGKVHVDGTFVTQRLVEVIPNPWVAHEVGNLVFRELVKRAGEESVARNLVYIVEEICKRAEMEKDRLTQHVFSQLIKDRELRFLLLQGDLGYCLPSKITVEMTSRTLVREDGRPLERSLLDFVPEGELNATETSVALYLEEQEKLLWWYRNLSRQDYAIQGWRKHRIFPDFIFSEVDTSDPTDYDKVFVVETKGIHLKMNEDTKYKQQVFDRCNQLAKERSWSKLGPEFPEKKVTFRVVFEDEWQRELNAMLAKGTSAGS
jgi:type III restriction enzyme